MAKTDHTDRWILAAMVILVLVIAHPVCNLLFRCGCSFFGAAHCNVHQAMGPHCPWCADSRWLGIIGVLWMGSAAVGIVTARRFGRGITGSVAGGLLGLALGVLASGALTVLLTGYPHFLWL